METLTKLNDKQSKAMFDAVLNGAKVATIAIETATKRTVHVCIGSAIDVIRAKAKRALEAGHSVTWEDGRTQWIEVSAICGSTESGGLFWHKDGNRVKCEKCLHTRVKGGKMDKEVLKVVWVDYIKAMGLDE